MKHVDLGQTLRSGLDRLHCMQAFPSFEGLNLKELLDTLKFSTSACKHAEFKMCLCTVVLRSKPAWTYACMLMTHTTL